MAKKIDILDAMEKHEFPTIFRAINDCIGTEYSEWMTACWPNVKGNGNFRMWFPKLAKQKGGELIPATFDCINTSFQVFGRTYPPQKAHYSGKNESGSDFLPLWEAPPKPSKIQPQL